MMNNVLTYPRYIA